MAVNAALLRGKTKEEVKVLKYFLDVGCMASFTNLKDEEYEQMVVAKLNSLNLRQRALDKIGIDEDQLQEIPPVFLHGYNFKDAHVKIGADDRLRSSKYEAAWLFFSDNQVYMYSYTFDMTSENKMEVTEEYFYKDITNFSTSTETTDARKISGCTGSKVTKITREFSNFALVVPGNKFYCSTSGVPDAEASISAMKQKLREKKQ